MNNIIPNKGLRLLIIAYLVILNFYLYAQQFPPLISNYHSQEFKASESNFEIAQDDNGVLYFGNFDGLLSYDGQEWQLIDISNGKTSFYLQISEKNKVYIATTGDFGYLMPDIKGNVKYQSLSKEFEHLNFGRVNDIVKSKEIVYILTDRFIFECKDDKISHTAMNSSYYAFNSFVHNNSLYITTRHSGILEFKNNKLQSTNLFDKYSDDIITSSITKKDTTILLGAYGNMYSFMNTIEKNDVLTHTTKSQLQKSISFRIKPSNNFGSDEYTIGTRRNGVVIINKGETLRTINKTNGLRDNDVRGIHYDMSKNLWITTFKGINKVSKIGQWSYWYNAQGLDGVIFDLIQYKQKMYLATSTGLYEIQNDKIIKINKSEIECFFIDEVGDNLITATIHGLSLLNKENELQQVSTQRAYGFQEIDNELLVHSVNGLIKLATNNTEEIKTIDNNIVGYLQNGLIHGNYYWFSLKNVGIYRYNSTNDSISIKYYEKHGLPSVTKNFIFQHNNELLFATKNGFYKVNSTPKKDSSNLFTPDYSLIKERIGVSNPATDSKGNIWYVATYGKFDSYVEKLELQEDGSYVKITRPFKWLPQQEFTKIYPDPDEEGIIWIAGTEGLYRYDDNVEVDYNTPFNTLVRKVHTGDSLIFGGTYFDPNDTAMVPSMVLDQPDAFKPTLTYDYNNISFQFTATSYDVPEKNEFSYYLKGNDEYWSAWATDNKKEYTNLDPGKYKFMVKSKNVYDTEGRTATYEFTILPPWYMTAWARGFFGIIALLAIWLMIRLYTYRLRLQRQKLKLIVADRTFEVMQQSKEIEERNTQLKEKAEEIKQQRDDIQEKNQELQSSQEEVLAINHKLAELNTHLEKEVENRTKKIKTTIEKLQKTNSELDTFIYRASHDLKSPISRIMGLSTLAKLEIPDSEHKEYFNLIELAANDMKNLLAKLTHVHEMFNKKVIFKEIDVPTLLGNIRESLKHHDQYNNTKYTFNIKNSLSLNNDEDIIRTILENLIENALIFRKKDSDEQHHIKIQIFENDNSVHIKVWDNGIGIYNDHFDQLYDMFFRASDQSKGTGLGLYLVKMSVDILKGQIEAESKPNEFTEFTVQLPIS